jgi:branched-chain amino acid transport system ATP-binding protein
MSVLLSISRLSKAFGAIRVADRVTLAVEPGEIVGVIGPNGAGKTSLFGLIAGNLRPDEGHIEFDGRDITRLAPQERARAGLARTYQIPKPFTHMTVAENLRVAAVFGAGLDERDAGEQVDRVLEETGMRSVRGILAGRLPLLMRKRHELARALATRPKLLLVDEVAAGLTDHEVNEFIDLVLRIRAGGVTILWIEHVMKTMLSATDRLVALNAGRVLASGAPDEVINSAEVRRVYLGA